MKSKAGVQVGGTSIIMVFVLLCITVFATLSLVSARADERLSQKSARSVSEYYQADARAEELLANIDLVLRTSAMEARDEESYRAGYRQPLEQLDVVTDGRTAAFSVEINSSQRLDVVLYLPYPAEGDSYLRRVQWVVTPTVLQGEQEDEMQLWIPMEESQ